jgi:membrane-associated phospholipid phosphatase
MAGFKKTLLISISTALLGVVVLFAFDTQIWISTKNLIPSDVIYIPKAVSRRGLYVFYFIFAGLMIYALYKKNQKLKDLWWAYIKAQFIFSFGVVRCMKIFFGRARPKYGGEFTFFSLDSHYNSFPSGHSADAFVSGVFLYYVLKYSKYSPYRFLPLAYALMIAFSRVAVSAHYLSDVVAGIAIGLLGAFLYVSKHHEKHTRQTIFASKDAPQFLSP